MFVWICADLLLALDGKLRGSQMSVGCILWGQWMPVQNSIKYLLRYFSLSKWLPNHDFHPASLNLSQLQHWCCLQVNASKNNNILWYIYINIALTEAILPGWWVLLHFADNIPVLFTTSESVLHHCSVGILFIISTKETLHSKESFGEFLFEHLSTDIPSLYFQSRRNSWGEKTRFELALLTWPLHLWRWPAFSVW